MGPAKHIYVGIVDDDESVCRSLGRLLRAAGFQAVTYTSGEAVLADLKHPHFDCLILDVQLGGMSGIELFRALRAAGETGSAIFLTAHDDPAARQHAQEMGCAAYFRKTEPGAVVLEVVRRVVGLQPTEPINTNDKSKP